jgi:hypothetical protein
MADKAKQKARIAKIVRFIFSLLKAALNDRVRVRFATNEILPAEALTGNCKN